MTAAALPIPGLERIRARFIATLDERKSLIAQHALAAWDGETAENINEDLEVAKSILHQIAGTAGTVGYRALGVIAGQCEAEITAHLDGPYADLAICPGEIIWRIDGFVAACDGITG